MNKGYDDRLQLRYPEGKLFSNAILALSVIEYCDMQNIGKEKYSMIVDNCVERIFSEKAKSNFNEDLEPAFGMFYIGWTNYTLKSYLRSPLIAYSKYKDRIIAESTLLEARINEVQNDSLRILNSYVDMNWPADNLIGLLSLDDNVLRQNWLSLIFEMAKSKTGLIHHSGSDELEIRGSSSALISYCLCKLDFEDLATYSNTYKEVFIDEILGIQLVKENENGSGHWDADSGPVIFSYGASASIMNIKTQVCLNKPSARYTWSFMNWLSLPVNWMGKKFYLMKKEPMLDLFMLWGSVEL